jgi:predicted metal-dependent enzyme (double-stranded beta helix superfamily)
MNQINTLKDLFIKLSTEFKENKKIKYFQEIVDKYDGDDWKQYTRFNTKSYQRVKLFSNKDFDSYLICWGPNQMSRIHNHAQNGCIQKTLQGNFTEILYNNDFKVLTIKKISENDVKYIDDSIGYHKFGNADPEISAVSLHIYSPANFQTKYFN